MRVWVFPSVVALLFAACGGRTGLRTGQVVPADASFDAVVLDWCGPADQHALFFHFDPAATCVVSGVLELSGSGAIFYGMALPDKPGQYPIESGEQGTTSGGYWCAAPSSCIPATGGTLTLTQMTHDVAVGSYEMSFDNGMTKSGTFTATVCNNPIACG